MTKDLYNILAIITKTSSMNKRLEIKNQIKRDLYPTAQHFRDLKNLKATIKDNSIHLTNKTIPYNLVNVLELVKLGYKIKGLKSKVVKSSPVELISPKAHLLHEDQKTFVKEWLMNPRKIMSHEMGIGKTPSTIIATHELMARENVEKILICTTSSTIPNWIKEFAKFSHACEVIEDTLSYAQLKKRYKFCYRKKTATKLSISEDDLFQSNISAIKGTKDLDNLKNAKIILLTHQAMDQRDLITNIEKVTGQKFSLMILDEAHIVANEESSRGKGVLEACKHIEKLLFLTGTPLNNITHKAVSFYLKCMFTELEHWYFTDSFTTVHNKQRAFKNIEDLQRLFSILAPHRLTWTDDRKKQYLNNETTRIVTKIDTSEEIKKEIKTIDKDMNAGQKTEATNRIFDPIKIQRSIEILEKQLATGDKATVFSRRNNQVHAIKAHFGDKAVVITGATPSNTRQSIIDKFMTDDSIRLFIGNIDAAGTGINLQNANYTLIIDPGYKAEQVEQCFKRVNRTGNNYKFITEEILLLDEELDSNKLKYVNQKSYATSRIIDGESKSITGVIAPETLIEKDLLEKIQRNAYALQRAERYQYEELSLHTQSNNSQYIKPKNFYSYYLPTKKTKVREHRAYQMLSKKEKRQLDIINTSNKIVSPINFNNINAHQNSLGYIKSKNLYGFEIVVFEEKIYNNKYVQEHNPQYQVREEHKDYSLLILGMVVSFFYLLGTM